MDNTTNTDTTKLIKQKKSGKLSKEGFYSLKNIDKENCQYNLVVSGRGIGKSYAMYKKMLENHVNSNYKDTSFLLRRWRTDIEPNKLQTLYSDFSGENGYISELTNGEWDSTSIYGGNIYLSKFLPKKNRYLRADKPFIYTSSLSQTEHIKGTSYNSVTVIFFDEFIATGGFYLPSEWTLFLNTLSTIIRSRTNVKIYMMGNTLDLSSPYITNMGIDRLDRLEQDVIQVYQLKNLKIAIEMPKNNPNSKKGSVYFSFNDSTSQMITEGLWDLGTYPIFTLSYDTSKILYSIFIKFESSVIQGDFLSYEEGMFLYFHEKTTNIKNEDRDIIFSLDTDIRPNHLRELISSNTKIQKRITYMFKNNLVYYSDAKIGSVVSKYIRESDTSQYV